MTYRQTAVLVWLGFCLGMAMTNPKAQSSSEENFKIEGSLSGTVMELQEGYFTIAPSGKIPETMIIAKPGTDLYNWLLQRKDYNLEVSFEHKPPKT